MNIFDDIFCELTKIVNQKLSELIEDHKSKVHGKTKEQGKHKNKCSKCKYNHEYAQKYRKKYKSLRSSCYCLLEKKMEQIRSLETENAALRNIKDKDKDKDKSIFINEISIMCRDILFD